MAVAGLTLGDDLAVLHIERGEQCGRAVAHIVVGDAFDVAQAHRQNRLCPLQRLNLAFLVDAEHQRFVRRVEVEPDDVAHFFDKEGIVRQLEGFAPMRAVWEMIVIARCAVAIQLDCFGVPQSGIVAMTEFPNSLSFLAAFPMGARLEQIQ